MMTRFHVLQMEHIKEHTEAERGKNIGAELLS